MPGYPLANTDTVLYEQKDVYSDKDINLNLLDGSKLNVWGSANYNGLPLGTSFVFDVRAYGAKIDGSTDDTVAIQTAIDTAPAGSIVLFSPGNAKITSPLSITKALTLRGSSQYASRIFPVGCGAIIVAAGVSNFRMENIELAAAVRHTVTPNVYVGIDIAGTLASKPVNHTYRDVYIDGFQTGFRSAYLWSSTWDNFRVSNGQIGMDIYGQSVNNFMTNNLISCDGSVGSRGIRFAGKASFSDASPIATEGWHILTTLTDNTEIGIEMIAITHSVVGNCIIDHNTKSAILIDDNGTNFAGNISLHDNYMAMTGALGTNAVDLESSIANTQAVGVRVHDNHIITYAGSTCQAGIWIADTSAPASIRGNILKGFAAYDIRCQIGGNIVQGNRMLSAVANNFYTTTTPSLVADNVGVVYLGAGGTTPNVYSVAGRMKITYTTGGAPTTGSWAAGDISFNYAPAVGQPHGWMCTVGGTPGTWVALANL
jgi:hypothetical protein